MNAVRARGSLGKTAVNAHLSIQPLLMRFRAGLARRQASAIVAFEPQAGLAEAGEAARPERPSARDAALPRSPGESWQAGFDAFLRGEIAPADSGEAEGWYWAENTAARRVPLD